MLTLIDDGPGIVHIAVIPKKLMATLDKDCRDILNDIKTTTSETEKT